MSIFKCTSQIIILHDMQKNNLSLERITFVRENRKKRFFDLNIFEF